MAYNRGYGRNSYGKSNGDPVLIIFSLFVMGLAGFLYTNRLQIFKFIKTLFIFSIELIIVIFVGYIIIRIIKKIIKKEAPFFAPERTFNASNFSEVFESVVTEPAKQQILESKVEAQKPQEVKEESRYKLNNGLVTPTEEKFMKVLEEVVGDRYRIVPQVQLSRIMKPVDSNSHFTNYKDFNLIKAKSIDFVLYDKDLLKPHVAIELDDWRHKLNKSKKNDDFKNKVMEEVGLRLIRIPVSYNYDLEWLRREIFKG